MTVMQDARLRKWWVSGLLVGLTIACSAPASDSPPAQVDGSAQPPAGAGSAPSPGSQPAAAPAVAPIVASAVTGAAPPVVRPADQAPAPPTSPPAPLAARALNGAAPVVTAAASPLQSPGVRAVSEREIRAEVATWRKVPYRDDGTTRKGIGNAGFTRAVAKQLFDVDLPARTDDQYRTGKLVERPDLQPGDLVFFEGKGVGPFRSRTVGMFVGRGEVALATRDLGVATVKLSARKWDDAYKTARRISSPATAEAPVIDAAAYGTNRAALLREVARAWVGTLYRQGGTTFEGIGNDEFVRSIYEAINDEELDGNPQRWEKMGKAVLQADLQPGDIILYKAVGIGSLIDRKHAGMYIGGGEFVHAVKGQAVTISKLKDARWAKAYEGARRIDPDPDPDLATVVGGAAVAARPATARSAMAGTSGRDLSVHERRLREATQPWLGTPYKLGGNTRSGVDCSGFTKAMFADVYGVELPRTAEDQERLGTKIDRRSLQPGDLVFFRTKGMGPFFKARHVGVYLGNGEFAQASGRLGVNIAPLSNRYWSKKYEGARRLQVPTPKSAN